LRGLSIISISPLKKVCTPPTKIGPISPQRVGRWRRMQARLDPRRLVFNGLSPKCRMATGRPPPSLSALRHDCVTAPLLLDGPMNGLSFKAYVEQILAPTLKHSDIVVMDNVSTAAQPSSIFHPTAPDLNPIEQFFC
jgi:hypothetical protein